jgi:hypothetical protein
MNKAPPISKDLIEYLEKVYAPAHFRCKASAPPHEIAAMVHQEQGQQYVVQHLRALHEEQQNEDHPSVYEST